MNWHAYVIMQLQSISLIYADKDLEPQPKGTYTYA